jgi:DNA-binding NarL/FixJ family response regulator
MRFLRDAYALRDLNDFITFLLTALPELIPSELTSYHEMGPRARRSVNWVIPAQPPERDEAWLRVMHQHPVMNHYLTTGGSEVELLSEFVSARQLRNMALFSEHYSPLGRIHDAVPIFWGSGEALFAIGLHRTARFTEREKAIANFLRSHLIQAHANALEVSKLEREASRLDKVLAASARALVVLKRDRAIEFATESARNWLRNYFGGASCAERLPEALDLWVRLHDSAVQRVLELPQPREPLVVNRAPRLLIVRMLSGDEEIVLLLEEQITSIHPASLGSLGLTHRESEVLAQIANGWSKTRIAQVLGTSTRTVDAHVRNIMEKLGVASSVAAAARAFQASRLGQSAGSITEDTEVRGRLIGMTTKIS